MTAKCLHITNLETELQRKEEAKMDLSLVLKFAFILFLSLAGAAASLTTDRKLTAFDSQLELPHSVSLSARPKATFLDLLSLLGSPEQANSVNSEVARNLYSCFKFLVPFNREPDALAVADEIDELILSPPAPVLQLARLAFDSGIDNHTAIRGQLKLERIPVPDVEGSNRDRCQLTATTNGTTFSNETLNSYLASLFDIIVQRGPSVGLNVSLNRYDLYHGHLFIAPESRRLGILFHAREYPVLDRSRVPLVNCEKGSYVAYNESMNLRNILWLAPLPSNTPGEWLAPGVLVALDANPRGIIYNDLITNQYYRYPRTLSEDNFGSVLLDVNYLNIGTGVPDFRIFICGTILRG